MVTNKRFGEINYMYDFPMVNIEANPTQKDSILLVSSELAELLKIEPQEIINFITGQITYQVYISISQRMKNKKSISLSSGFLKKTHLQTRRTYGISRQNDGIHIGPVVGVMAQIYNKPGRPFGGQTLFIRELIKAGHLLGQICFGFNPHSIDWSKKVIRGFTYGSSGWVRSIFPIPDVIYPRERGYSPPIQQIRERLEKMGCKFINPSLIGKWNTYKILSQTTELKHYLPETKLLNNFQQVSNMINRHNAVYMKPVNGSKGRNIIKVIKDSDTYKYQYQVNNKIFQGTSRNISSLRSSLRPIMGKRNYIVQKKINLLSSQGGVIDVRVMVQKDHTGRWIITGNICRIGRTGSITSNIAAGGHASHLSTVLSNNFRNENTCKAIEQEVKKVALDAAQALEASVGSIGELGIDIGIDQNARVWFIEANLKPARQVFILVQDKQGRHNSIERPLLYSRYLAGF
jgi:glutathione synthase/RimK-type ligase-like ATP-grasp enzyme